MFSINWFMADEQLQKYDGIWTGEVTWDTVNFYKDYAGTLSNNENLAGHLQKQIKIEDLPVTVRDDIMRNFRRPEVTEYVSKYKDTMNPIPPIKLETTWVNYMKKTEFNPLHRHGGLFSFVIFIQIPYDLSEEDKVFPDTPDKKTSRLGFVFNEPLAGPEEITLDVDESFVGKIILFDAKLPHLVYPFYTSDECRITASGNVVFAH